MPHGLWFHRHAYGIPLSPDLFLPFGPGGALSREGGMAPGAGVHWTLAANESGRMGGIDGWAIVLAVLALEVIYRAFVHIVPAVLRRPCWSQLEPKQRSTLHELGPSYAVSILVTVVLAWRGSSHFIGLVSASDENKLCIADTVSKESRIHVDVMASNHLFMGYLIYDVLHVLFSFPKLGKLDTVAHHLGYLFAATINGYYRTLLFPFAWLLVGELSSPALSARWFLINLGLGHTRAMHLTNIVFAATFLFARLLVFGGGLLQLVQTRDIFLHATPGSSCAAMPTVLKWLVLVLICGGFGLNCLWLQKIVAMATGQGKKLRKASRE